jgi:hypothetical protein
MNFINQHKYFLGFFIVLIVSLMLCNISVSQKNGVKQKTHHEQFKRMLRNVLITKNTADDEHFQLRNGKYNKFPFTVELLDPIVFAHLYSDSNEYAIVPMDLNCFPGNGNFFHEFNKEVQHLGNKFMVLRILSVWHNKNILSYLSRSGISFPISDNRVAA